MTITLASLVDRLAADVPAQNGTPTTEQYTQAVKDAVADLSRRASVPRMTTLAIVAGQASYSVPSDFQRVIRLAQIGAPIVFGSSYLEYGQYNGWGWGNDPRGGVYVAPSGLVPFAGSYREQITVTGDTLTIYPTPQTSADRQLVYAAGDALNDAGDAYDTLTEARASVALLYAQATCLERIASTPRMDAITLHTGQDTAGQDRLDTTKRAEALRQTATQLRNEYLSEVASLNIGTGGLSSC